MKDNQVMFYHTSVKEVMEILEMETRKDLASIELNDFEVKLNKRGEHTLITLVRGLDHVQPIDGIIDLKIAFPGKYRDMESIEKVQEVLKIRPSKWWENILADLQDGEPLGWKVEEILLEIEDRAKNPDPDVLMKLNKLIAMNPSNDFYRSLYHQFRGGLYLSDKQLDIIEDRYEILTDPTNMLLDDLRVNANLKREDYMLILKGKEDGIDSLKEEDRRRLRHLIYRNQKRLQNTYSQKEIRKLIKKGRTNF